jgi:hypothetical protein
MSNQESNESARPTRKLVKSVGKRVALNMIPGYPLVGIIKGFRKTTAPGAAVIADLAGKMPQKRTGKRVRTWNEALRARHADALPLREIERLNTRAKQVFMALGCLSLSAGVGCAMGGNWVGVFSSCMFILICLMQMFKFELRLRQMETGPRQPDRALMSASEFLGGKGFLRHLMNPRVVWR